MGFAPFHTKQLEDPLLIPRLEQVSLGVLHSTGASEHVLEEATLVEAHVLLRSEEPDTSVEDVIPGEIDQGGAKLALWDEQEINPTPRRSVLALVFGEGSLGQHTAAVPFAAVVFASVPRERGERRGKEPLVGKEPDKLP